MHRGGPVAVAFLLLVALPVGAEGGDAPGVVVTYSYAGAGNLTGSLVGNCQAYGAIWGAGQEVLMQAQGVRLEHVVTWVNRSSVRPGEPEELALSSPFDYNRTVEWSNLTDGLYRVTISAAGVGAFRPWGYPEGERASMLGAFEARDAFWTSVREGVAVAPHVGTRPSPGGPQFIRNGLGFEDGSYPDGARGWVLNGARVSLTGSTVLHLREAVLAGPDLTIRLPPHATEIQNATLPLKAFHTTTWRLEEAFLHVENFTLSSDLADATFACGALAADVDGHVTVLQASGEASTSLEAIPFENRVLTLKGFFRLDEGGGSDQIEIDARAEGDIHLVGFDFQPAVTIPVVDGLVVKIGLGVMLVAAAGVLAKKGWALVAVLFNRLAGKDVIDDRVRAQILAAVQEHRFLAVGDFMEQLTVTRGNVRHHLGTLIRAGLLRVEPLEGRKWYLDPRDRRADLVRFIVQQDERLQAVHAAVASGKSRAQLVADLTLHFGVTSGTIRKYLSRYRRLMAEGGDPTTPPASATVSQEIPA